MRTGTHILIKPARRGKAEGVGRARSSKGIYGRRVSGKPISTAVRVRGR